MYELELKTALFAAKEASKIIMEIYNENKAIVNIKSDDSPVTQADLMSDKLIRDILSKAFPGYGLLSEETEDNDDRLTKDYVWIIDPIDGTKDFVSRTNEFTINIALSYKGEIVVGVIALPALNEYFYAVKNEGSFREIDGKLFKNKVSDKEKELIILGSRFHYGESEKKYYEEHQEFLKEKQTFGSSYKACKIACGEADLYVKVGKGTKEWDVAPMAIIVKEAGGVFAKPNGDEFIFNKKDVYNHDGFIVMNKINDKLFVK